VAPAKDGTWKRPLQYVFIDGNAFGPETRSHRSQALDPPRAKRRHGLAERRIIVADKVPKDVKLAAFEFARQLNARNELDSPPGRFCSSNWQSRHGIVVRDSHGSEPHSKPRHHDLARRARSVGMSGVHMQISRATARPKS
jgi:hypothetical protein